MPLSKCTLNFITGGIVFFFLVCRIARWKESTCSSLTTLYTHLDCTPHLHLQNGRSYESLSLNVHMMLMRSRFRYRRRHLARSVQILDRIVHYQEQILVIHARVGDTRPGHQSYSIRRRKLSPIRRWCRPLPVLLASCSPQQGEHSNVLVIDMILCE